MIGFRTLLRDLWLRKNAAIGIALVGTFVVMAIGAPFIAPYDPLAQSLANRLQPPSAEHWLGTDGLGRDLLSRIIWGSRVSLIVGCAAIAIGASTGITLGLVSGFFGGQVDNLLMRLIDITMAFPTILLAIAVVAFFGRGEGNLIIAIGISNIPEFTRLTRGEVLRLRNLDFVAAGRALGASSLRLMLRHILPNLVAIMVILSTMRVSVAILAESSLSFLGLGIPPPTPSWGVMLSEGQRALVLAPWLSIAPGFGIALLVLGFNLLGDGLRDVLDPRTRIDRLAAGVKKEGEA
jgi:peptide/nickel transport system permease protein